MHYLKVNYSGLIHYEPCSDAQKYELKFTGKIKSLLFFDFIQIFRSIAPK